MNLRLLTFIIISIFLHHSKCNKESLQFIGEEIHLRDATQSNQFADYLNALYGTSKGDEVLTMCSKPYSPDANSHELFINQFKNVYSTTSNILSSKRYPQINGEVCEYNLSDVNIFVSAKKARVNVSNQSVIKELLYKTAFGKSALEFSKCIGQDNLNKIADAGYIKEMLDVLSSDSYITKFFESFCSINNIFAYTKTVIDPTNPELYQTMGGIIHDFIVKVKVHYDSIKK